MKTLVLSLYHMHHRRRFFSLSLFYFLTPSRRGLDRPLWCWEARMLCLLPCLPPFPSGTGKWEIGHSDAESPNTTQPNHRIAIASPSHPTEPARKDSALLMMRCEHLFS